MKSAIKRLRSSFLLRELIYPYLRSLKIPNRIYQHLYFHGIFEVREKDINPFKIYHLGTSFENDLYWRGLAAYEPTSIAIWKALSKNARVIIDGGANTGLYSLVAGASNKDARIIAFEPVDFIYERLKKNINANSFFIKAECVALSQFDSVKQIHITPGDHPVNCSLEDLSAKQDGVMTKSVKTTSLDSYLAQNSLEVIDLVKLDLEFHEPQALEGALSILARFKPAILMEVNTTAVGNSIKNILEPFGYCYYRIDEGSGLTASSELHPPNGLKWGQNFLALHGTESIELPSIPISP